MKTGKTSPKARVFLVDDHPIVRRGFQLLLGLQPDLAVCGEADSASGAMEQIERLQPELVVVDLALKKSSGLDLIKQLRSQCPKVKILVFTMHDEAIYTERALRAGAHGYITKEEGTEKAVEAIRAILRGKPYIPESVASRVLESMTGFSKPSQRGTIESLSDRELQVLELIARGVGSGEIAQQLHLSIKTVESHREHIKSKLGLRSAPELMQYAFNWLNHSRPI